MVIFSMLRFDVGNDYKVYYLLGEKSKNLNIELHYEIFEFVSKILYKITWFIEHPQVYIILSSIIIYSYYYLTLKNYKYKIEALIVYQTFPFFLNHLSIIRQGMAEANMLLFTKFLGKNNYIYLIGVGVSYLYHKSSIVCLMYLPLYYIKVNKYILGLFIVIRIPKNIISKIISYSSYSKYEIFKNNELAGGTKLIYLYIILNIIIIILYRDKLLAMNKKMNFYINSVVFGGFIYNNLRNLHGMRISEYFFIMYIFIISKIISIEKKNKIYIYILLIVLYFLLIYIGRRNLLPYKNYLLEIDFIFKK